MYAPKDLVICSFVAAGTLLPSLRRIVSKADPQLPVSDVKSLTEIVEAATRPRTVQVRILGAVAAVSFLLAGIGIHGRTARARSASASRSARAGGTSWKWSSERARSSSPRASRRESRSPGSAAG